MASLQFQKFGRVAGSFVGIVAVVGCPQQMVSQSAEGSLTGSTDQQVIRVAVEATVPSAIASHTLIDYAVCSDLRDWRRPSATEQSKQLQADPRYFGALETDPLKTMAQTFWQHEILSFTTYGLSARVEPMNFAGLWSAVDQVWTDCYAGEQAEEINTGVLAEAWLMNHRVTALSWQDNRYVMRVEPVATGLQVVQFRRLESEAMLPLTVETVSGQPIEVFSGDL